MKETDRYTYVHLRPTTSDGKKSHPVGTIAIGDRQNDEHRIGFSACRLDKDTWNAKTGRDIARQRAELGRAATKSCRFPAITIKYENIAYRRRELIFAALLAVEDAIVHAERQNLTEIFFKDRVPVVSKKFVRALRDTIERLRNELESSPTSSVLEHLFV